MDIERPDHALHGALDDVRDEGQNDDEYAGVRKFGDRRVFGEDAHDGLPTEIEESLYQNEHDQSADTHQAEVFLGERNAVSPNLLSNDGASCGLDPHRYHEHDSDKHEKNRIDGLISDTDEAGEDTEDVEGPAFGEKHHSGGKRDAKVLTPARQAVLCRALDRLFYGWNAVTVDRREEEHEEVGDHCRQAQTLDSQVVGLHAEEAEKKVDDGGDHLGDHWSLRILQARQESTSQVEKTKEIHCWNHGHDIRVCVHGHTWVLTSRN